MSEPKFKHGKVSYMQIPAPDVEAASSFYEKVFGWTLSGDEQHRSFTDASGELIGAFIRELAVAPEPGVLPYISVDRIDDAVAKIESAGGSIVRAPYPEGGLWVATFRDPSGNLVGIWQFGPR
jgi:predicted enzyme related to lactoylglutathione lyase